MLPDVSMLIDFARMVIEIAILTLVIYKILYYMRGARGSYVLAGIIILLVALIVMAAMFVLRLGETSRWSVAFFYAVATLLLVGKRGALRMILRRYRAMGYNQKRVLLVGHGESAETYLERVTSDKRLGYQVVGYVADQSGWDALPYCGTYAQLEEVFQREQPDEVVVAVPTEEGQWIGKIINACEKDGTKLSVVPSYVKYMPSNPQFDSVDGLPLINLRRIPLDNLGNAFFKRAVDVVCSLLLIVLTSPLMLIAAIGVKLSSPGPIIFKQERVGKDKKPFYMYKFRSMRVNVQQETGWSTDYDPRKTHFGSFIRKFSLDELPQFFNVLKGDMSLVGPRPEVPFHVEHFKEEIPRYLVRQQVRPGCTGWAQVHGLRGDTDIAERIRYDIWYIENWTVALDIKIIFRTVFGGKMVNDEKLQ